MKTLNLVNNPILETKKILFLFSLAFLFATQVQAQTSIGGGLGYNKKIAGPGVTLKAEFHITDKIAISPSGTYFFGRRLGSYRSSAISADINAHYFFDIIDEKLKIYPVVGANYINYKTAITFFGVYDQVNESAFGGNIGAGARWTFSDKLSVYLEPKFVVGGYNQVVVNAGVFLKL